jgi:ribosomal protein S18 acetylase RimI-like enzyme
VDPNPADLMRVAGEGWALYARAAPGFEARFTPTAWMVASGEPEADWNYAWIGAGADAGERLREYAGVFAARRHAALFFVASEVASGLAPIAPAVGLRSVGRVPLMVRSVTGGPPATASPFAVEIAADGVAIAATNDVLAAATGLPRAGFVRVAGPALLASSGVTVFLARSGDTPISSLATTAQGEFVGVWTMGTDPAWQRQGAGRAVLEYALAHHAARGAEVAYLLSSVAGRRLYEGAGFRAVEEDEVWLAGSSTQFPDS